MALQDVVEERSLQEIDEAIEGYNFQHLRTDNIL